MTLHLTIVTGASRGLGHALAEALLAREGQFVLTMSRARADVPAATGTEHRHWSVDLAEPILVAKKLQAWLGTFDAARFTTATIIHNAAILVPPGPLEDVSVAELSRSMRVNLEAPLLLTRAFLVATSGWTAVRRVLLVSSGLGRHAMAGSAAYCAAKAGMDHLARTLVLEQADRRHGARLVSLAPGVIDTDMQVQLRAADPARFAAHARFVELMTEGQLDTPAQCATKVLAYLERADFGAEPVADVRTAA